MPKESFNVRWDNSYVNCPRQPIVFVNISQIKGRGGWIIIDFGGIFGRFGLFLLSRGDTNALLRDRLRLRGWHSIRGFDGSS